MQYLPQPQLCSLSLEIHVDERIKSIQQAFINRTFVGDLKPSSVLPLTILLFFAMLPLHADDPNRQTALLANALRLYAGLVAEENSSK